MLCLPCFEDKIRVTASMSAMLVGLTVFNQGLSRLHVNIYLSINISLPNVSTIGSFLTIAFLVAILMTPMASVTVTTMGKPSGIAATARLQGREKRSRLFNHCNSFSWLLYIHVSKSTKDNTVREDINSNFPDLEQSRFSHISTTKQKITWPRLKSNCLRPLKPLSG